MYVTCDPTRMRAASDEVRQAKNGGRYVGRKDYKCGL